MDDGTYTGAGLRLHTDAFSKSDIHLLIKTLNTNLNIKATVNIHNKQKGHNTIYISKDQLSLVRSLVKDYMYPSMLYKLGPNS